MYDWFNEWSREDGEEGARRGIEAKREEGREYKRGVSDFCGAWIRTDKEGEGGWRKSPHSETEFSRRHLQHEPQRKEGKSRDVYPCGYVRACVYVRVRVCLLKKIREGTKDSERETERESSTYREGNSPLDGYGVFCNYLPEDRYRDFSLSLLFFDVFVIIFPTASVGCSVVPLDFNRYAGQKGGTRGGILPRTRDSQEDEEWKMKKRELFCWVT